MEISDTLFQAFNTQYSRELTNSDAYYQLANVAGDLAWDGCEKFLLKSSGEEREHAGKIRDFLLDRNREPVILAKPEQSVNAKDPLGWITIAYGLEQANTKLILTLNDMCDNENDEDAENFLIWFIEEQRKSERELYDWIQRLTRAGDNIAALLMLDEDIGT
jgi:ferritin